MGAAAWHGRKFFLRLPPKPLDNRGPVLYNHIHCPEVRVCGPVVQLVRTLACHARGRRFEPVPGRHAAMAQAVERILGKDEVSSSNLDSSSTSEQASLWKAANVKFAAFVRFAALPLGKRSRLLRLFPCKRGNDACAALPTFCRLRAFSLLNLPQKTRLFCSGLGWFLFLPNPADFSV